MCIIVVRVLSCYLVCYFICSVVCVFVCVVFVCSCVLLRLLLLFELLCVLFVCVCVRVCVCLLFVVCVVYMYYIIIKLPPGRQATTNTRPSPTPSTNISLVLH